MHPNEIKLDRLSPEEWAEEKKLLAGSLARIAKRFNKPVPQSVQNTLDTPKAELACQRRNAMLEQAQEKPSMCIQAYEDVYEDLPESVSLEAFQMVVGAFYDNDYVIVRRSALKTPAAE